MNDIVIIDHISILNEFNKYTSTSSEILNKFSKIINDLDKNLKIKSRRDKIEKYSMFSEKRILILKSRQSGKSYMNSMAVLKEHLYGFRKFSRCQSIKKIFNI